MEALLNFLQAIYPITAELQQHLCGIMQYRKIKRGEILLRAGHQSRHIYFLEKGLLRCYYTKHQQEICSWFLLEGDVVISPQSFFKQIPSHESIQALEESELHYIGYSDLQELYQLYLEFNVIGRVLTEKYYLLSDQRLYGLMMERAAEKYEHVATHHPEWLKRVPGIYLASYLGITNVWLSKTKAQYQALHKPINHLS